MHKYYVSLTALLLAMIVATLAADDRVPAKNDDRPNVLFLAVDDMKDWVNCLGGYEGTVHTPNIDRLAERGMLFTNAPLPVAKVCTIASCDHDGTQAVHDWLV